MLHALRFTLPAGLIVLFAIILPGCAAGETPTMTPPPVNLRIAADAAVMPLVQALARTYTQRYPNANVRFALTPTTSSDAAGSAADGQADLGAVSTLPEGQAGSAGLWMADLAMDGVAVIVHAANPLTHLTTQQVRDIFAGAYSDWEALGAPGLGDMQVAVREDGDGARAIFDRVVMGGAPLGLDAVVLSSIDVAMNYVAYQPGAITYVPSSRITATVVPPVKVLSIDGKTPSPESVGGGAYPMSHMLYFIAPREPQGELRNFVAWAVGDEGQRVAAAANYASLTAPPSTPTPQP